MEERKIETIQEFDSLDAWYQTVTDSIRIYTDGACSKNPGTGGFGAVLLTENAKYEMNGGEPHTTNNRMEMRAAIEPLQQLVSYPVSCPIILWTDSLYLKNGVTLWIQKWKTNGWQTADKKEVKNQDLWQQLDQLSSQFRLQWKWVRGHDGHYWNERADLLAGQGIVAQRMK